MLRTSPGVSAAGEACGVFGFDLDRGGGPESVVLKTFPAHMLEGRRPHGRHPAAIVDDLRHQLDRYAERGGNGRVFVGERGASPRRRNVNRLWRTATLRAGIDSGVGLGARAVSW